MTASQAPATAEELRGAGLRGTAVRVALLETVRNGDHLGAEAIASGVRDRVGHVSLQAVYDALHALTAAGLLPRLEPAGRAVSTRPAARPGSRGASGTTITTWCAGHAVSSPTSTARSARRPA